MSQQHTSTDQTEDSGTTGAGGSGGSATGNGTGRSGGEATSPNIQRAEEIVDQVAERVAQYTSAAGRALLRWTARMREEAEDIWAEAQEVRKRKKP